MATVTDNQKEETTPLLKSGDKNISQFPSGEKRSSGTDVDCYCLLNQSHL
jgi:hypothetical protein